MKGIRIYGDRIPPQNTQSDNFGEMESFSQEKTGVYVQE